LTTTTRVRFDANSSSQALQIELSRAKFWASKGAKSWKRVFQQNRPASDLQRGGQRLGESGRSVGGAGQYRCRGWATGWRFAAWRGGLNYGWNHNLGIKA